MDFFAPSFSRISYSARYNVDYKNIKHVKHENFKSFFTSHVKHAIEK